MAVVGIVINQPHHGESFEWCILEAKEREGQADGVPVAVAIERASLQLQVLCLSVEVCQVVDGIVVDAHRCLPSASIQRHVARHHVGAEVPLLGAGSIGEPFGADFAVIRDEDGLLDLRRLVAPDSLCTWWRAVTVAVEGDDIAPVQLPPGGHTLIPVTIFPYCIPLRFCPVVVKISK